jgi:hypothetical protein
MPIFVSKQVPILRSRVTTPALLKFTTQQIAELVFCRIKNYFPYCNIALGCYIPGVVCSCNFRNRRIGSMSLAISQQNVETIRCMKFKKSKFGTFLRIKAFTFLFFVLKLFLSIFGDKMDRCHFTTKYCKETVRSRVAFRQNIDYQFLVPWLYFFQSILLVCTFYSFW